MRPLSRIAPFALSALMAAWNRNASLSGAPYASIDDSRMVIVPRANFVVIPLCERYETSAMGEFRAPGDAAMATGPSTLSKSQINTDSQPGPGSAKDPVVPGDTSWIDTDDAIVPLPGEYQNRQRDQFAPSPPVSVGGVAVHRDASQSVDSRSLHPAGPQRRSSNNQRSGWARMTTSAPRVASAARGARTVPQRLFRAVNSP